MGRRLGGGGIVAAGYFVESRSASMLEKEEILDRQEGMVSCQEK